MIRVIHGDDEFAISNALESYLAALGSPELRAPNVTIFERPGIPLGEIMAAARVIPFLTDRRAVVVKDMLAALDARGSKPRGDWADFGDIITRDGISIVNDLLFVERTHLRMTSAALKSLAAIAEVEVHNKPKRNEMLDWLQERFRLRGTRISMDALQHLQYLGGDDTRRLDGEIEKLALYAGDRMIERSDIDLMVSASRQESIFRVIDAIIDGQPPRALSGLRNLLDNGESIEGVFALLSRQVRLLILSKHLMSARVNRGELRRRLRINNDWVLDKTCRQANSRSMDQLTDMHRQMLDVDIQIKTGRAHRHVAIETLIARLSGNRVAVRR